MSYHHLAKWLSLSFVHDSGINSLLIPETRLLYQYSVPGSKHTSSKLCFLRRIFHISLDCLQVNPDFDSCYSHFMLHRMTSSVRHKAIEVHYYYYHRHPCVATDPIMFCFCLFFIYFYLFFIHRLFSETTRRISTKFSGIVYSGVV